MVKYETFWMIFKHYERKRPWGAQAQLQVPSRFSTWYVNVLTIHLSEIKVHLLLFPSFHGLIWKVLGMENRESEAQGEKAEQLWSYSRAKVFAFSNFSHDSSRRPAALQTTAGEQHRGTSIEGPDALKPHYYVAHKSNFFFLQRISKRL